MADDSRASGDAGNATPARRPGGRNARLRERMLAAATELVARDGIERFRYEEVAELAGVNKTTVYRNWPDHAELAVEALSSFDADTIAVKDSGDLRADLAGFLVALADSLSTPRGRALSHVAASASANEEVTAIVETAHERRMATMHRRLEKAFERGELPPVDVHFLTEMLSGPVHLLLRRGRRSFSRADAERIVDIVLAGLHAVHAG
ncbi:TetR/AcrR family transcriptional regulator [Streptomyces sp. 8L]|uniref:TetR/AcrR family transcriptional regulator n=1 Tax=Streptomyces sp. 8L TaxID=2877242 RepID=UPI001CD6B5E7|nr:TetR/AcrR family transcriptional regulator [Streptomyces sp. 8L]MCA1220068.1 TetR/AcrR family transcriptional regulator [Streptomyces sp. 8L]